MKGGQILKRIESFEKGYTHRNIKFSPTFLVKLYLRFSSASLKIGQVYIFMTKKHRLQGI